MKSSLMVKDDSMRTCQKGNQLKGKKNQMKERREKQDGDSSGAAYMSHQDTSAIKAWWGKIKALWICVCNPVCVCLCVCVWLDGAVCMSAFAYLADYQFWLQSFPLHRERYQSSHLMVEVSVQRWCCSATFVQPDPQVNCTFQSPCKSPIRSYDDFLFSGIIFHGTFFLLFSSSLFLIWPFFSNYLIEHNERVSAQNNVLLPCVSVRVSVWWLIQH